MNPYVYVQQALHPGDSLLSLCAGIGLELEGLRTENVTAVDIVPQYLEKIKTAHPQFKTVHSDALAFVRLQKNNSFDVISILDGIEHLDKPSGLRLIKEMKRVARRQILLFTPQGPGSDGYLKNEPHNAWGVEGADEHQTHKSGWTSEELQELGFRTLLSIGDVSQHGERYTALMMSYRP